MIARCTAYHDKNFTTISFDASSSQYVDLTEILLSIFKNILIRNIIPYQNIDKHISILE